MLVLATAEESISCNEVKENSGVYGSQLRSEIHRQQIIKWLEDG